MRKILNEILGFMPVSRRRFERLLASLDEVLDTFVAIDAQHSNIEKTILEKLCETKQRNESNDTQENHVEFG